MITLNTGIQLMIDMKGLTREERTLITITCEPFYIGYKVVNSFKKIHSELLGNFLPNHKKDLWVFITACSQALRHNLEGVMFTLNKNNYAKANKLNGSKLSYVKCKRIVQEMHDLGYITFYKGFYDHKAGLSVRSCFIINDKLKAMFDRVDFKRFGNPRPIETLVEIRDSETDMLITSLSKLRGIKSKRALVKQYNEFLTGFDIRCKSRKACAVYKRVFTDSLDKHGRWYSQSTLQTTKSYLRKSITIDGYSTTEVDYMAQHPRILLELSGIKKPMSWQPYVDITDILKCDAKVARKFSKIALLCLLNSKSVGVAKSALWKHYEDDMKKSKEDRVFGSCKFEKGGKGITKIFDRLIEHNHEISHWFGKEDLWAILQHYDSQMVAHVLTAFMEEGKCCLPWHDSFIAERKDQDFLIECMRNAWKEVLQTNHNCFYDIEF